MPKHSSMLSSLFASVLSLSLFDLNYARLIFDHLNSPNIYLYTAMITAYGASQRDHSSSLLLYRDMLRRANPLVDMYGKCGSLLEARRDFGKTSKRNLTSWNSMINCFALHGQSDSGICVFEEMMGHDGDIKPDAFAAKRLIDIDPNNGGYRIMLANVYSELGKWDEVRKVRKVLKEQNAHRTPGCSWIEIDNQAHQFYSVDKAHPRIE